MNIGFVIAGIVYAIVFWAITLWRPRYALLLILAVAPFQNDISGGGPLKFSLTEINLLLTLPVALFRARRWRFGPTFLPAVAYLLAGFLSSLVNWRDSTLTSLVQAGIYLIVVVTVFASLVRTEEDYRKALNAFVVVCCFVAITVIVQRSGFVFGLHKNGVGASLATAFVITFEFCLSEQRPRLRFAYMAASGLLACGCLVTLSRGSWLAILAGVLIVFAMRRQFALIIKMGVVLIPVVMIAWLALPSESRDYATGFETERENIRLRYESIDFALDQFRSSPLIGVGVGLRKEYDATNFFLLTIAEMGVLGALTMAILYVAMGRFLWRLHLKLPRGGMPYSLTVIAGALIFGKLAHGMVDHYWTRGSLTVAWASLGMAIFVSSEVRRLRRLAEENELHSPQTSDAPEKTEPAVPRKITPAIQVTCV